VKVGEPMEPKNVRAKFRYVIGALVKDQMNPAIPSWKQLPIGIKATLWAKLASSFRLPSGIKAII
jgi:hypothetical protein